MTIENIRQAIETCDNGDLNFNLGNNRSLLYNSKWYPLRAVVNFARGINNEGDLTTNNAQLALSLVIPYLRIARIDFLDHLPIALNNNEKLNEIKFINEIIGGLVNNN